MTQDVDPAGIMSLTEYELATRNAKNPKMGLTSNHFKEHELACPHCGVNGVTQKLLTALEAFRAAVNAAWREPNAPEIPVLLDSAYRCPVHNRAVGGSLRSQHMLGRGADVKVRGKTARELYDLSLKVPNIHGRGVSDHAQFLHVDVREEVQLAKWCYSPAGAEVAWYDA